MKIKELKENEPLKVIEVLKHYEMPTFNDKSLNAYLIEFNQIKMRIFTDGTIEKSSEEISENIEEYYIGKNKFQYDVDTLKTKDIFLKNHSYVIVYLIAREYMTMGKVRGWFDVIKDVTIYLENIKDRNALKTAKQVIKQIQKCNNSASYSSIFGMVGLQGKGLEQFESEKILKNVYSLKNN